MSKCSKELRELLLEGLSALRWSDSCSAYIKAQGIKYVNDGWTQREERVDSIISFLEDKLREANNV